jgi:hypothetical protein
VFFTSERFWQLELRFEDLTEVLLKTQAFWNSTDCQTLKMKPVFV